MDDKKDSTSKEKAPDGKSSTSGNAKEHKPKTIQKIKISKKALRQAEQELFNLLVDRKKLEKELIVIEKSLYDQETQYLTATSNEGNILKGFTGFLGGGRVDRRRDVITDDDRIFSGSSSTFRRISELSQGIENSKKGAGGSGFGAGSLANKIKAASVKHKLKQKSQPSGSSSHHSGALKTKKLKLSVDNN